MTGLRTLAERRRRVLLGVALSWAFAVSAAGVANAVQFPGFQSELASPDHRWVLVWMPADVAPGGKHLLTLRGPADHQRVLLEFERSVRVSWSPDSQRIAIVDAIGSDTSESSVYSTGTEPPIVIWSALRAQQGQSVELLVAGAHHRYVEADRWLDAETLSVRVWGYGGEKPFDERFRLKLSK